MATQDSAQAVQRIIDALYKLPEDRISKWEVCGRLGKLREELEEQKHVTCASKRESDASNCTRQEGSDIPPNQRKGSRGRKKKRRGSKSSPASIEKDSTSPKSGPKEVQTTTPPVPTQETSGGKEKKEPSTQGGWTTVARKADKAKPGNVNIRSTSPKIKKQTSPSARTTTPSVAKREAGVIRAEITREDDWQNRVGATTQELIEQVREAIGGHIASQIGSIKVYEGGDLKITPRARATDLQKDLTWIDAWIPSAVPANLIWKEIVVHGVPYEGSADEVLDQLWIQNDDAIGDYRPGACKWLGKPEQPRRKAALRIKLSNAEEANDMIINGVFLDYAHLQVSRYWSDGPFRGRTRNQLFNLPERTETPEDRMEEDDESFRDSQSPSPPPSVIPPSQEATAPTQEVLEVLETSREPRTSSESSGQKRLREPSPSGEREAPKRGRPLGAIGRPKFRGEKLQGASPFAIAQGLTLSKTQSPGTQVPATQ